MAQGPRTETLGRFGAKISQTDVVASQVSLATGACNQGMAWRRGLNRVFGGYPGGISVVRGGFALFLKNCPKQAVV